MLDVLMNVIFFGVMVYSSKKMIDDIIEVFDGGDNIIGFSLLAALVLVWGIAISFVAFNYVFPWWDSL